MIDVKNISIKKRLRNCSFTVERGKIAAIIGENGSGKTTVLEAIAGVLSPDRGSIELPHDRSELISYCPEQAYFYHYFSVEALFDFYQSQFHDFNRGKAEALADFFQLDRQEKMAYLSKGQVNRAKIAVTLARDCPYLVLDEPLAGLDPIVKQKIVQGIIHFIDLEQQSLLITTHELLEIETILDEVIVMRDGHVIAQEEVETIREGMPVQEWLQQLYETV
ncbi:ATP-binding cassette domain-containing protein [Gracilibacillus alcaliphilus]|uniref:ATP-binding cassette domain-containing protein n=1 Tax=Gracilibacillus alcaliphilus TaxID=1401441 RepID=UPI00195D3C8C|nr:ABC transporter ATP-binding protein [Gracilibacillus alcaliphilus]MBM7675843.1 ABC-2 type transport system ATP-binding protein [Gracilibacillus alcaliphilus]